MASKSLPKHDAAEVLPRLARLLKGAEGCYGARGGPMLCTSLGEVEGFPALRPLLTRLGESHSSKWMCTTCPCHQVLFPRSNEQVDEPPGLLEQVYELACEVEATQLPQPISERALALHSFMTNGPRLLFVDMTNIHDGDCPIGCPRDDTVFLERIPGRERPGSRSYTAYMCFQLPTGEVLCASAEDFRG